MESEHNRRMPTNLAWVPLERHWNALTMALIKRRFGVLPHEDDHAMEEIDEQGCAVRWLVVFNGVDVEIARPPKPDDVRYYTLHHQRRALLNATLAAFERLGLREQTNVQ